MNSRGAEDKARPDEVEHLFVYGSLKPGCRLYPAIEQHVRRACPGMIVGKLIDLGHFPALMPGDGLVRGILLDVAPEALATTDRIEGCGCDPRTSFYIRKRFCVHLDDGKNIDAWAYELAERQSVAHGPELLVGHVEGRPLYAWSQRDRM